MKNRILLFASLFAIPVSIFSQLAYAPELSQRLQLTYTDLGTSGNAIPTSNKDNANSAAQTIGFNFNYNGANYTHFVLNTNGFVKLGTSAAMTMPSAANLGFIYFNQNYDGVFNSTNANDDNILAVFNHDLDSSTTAQTEYRRTTTGAVGSRVCTIQFKNVRDKNISDSNNSPLPHVQFNAMNFQIKLYETTNIIEFIYGTFIPSSDSCLFKLAGVGLKGTSSEFLTVQKSSSHVYDLAIFVAANYIANTPPNWATQGFGFGNDNFAKSIPTYAIRPLPKSGQAYRFLPKKANDASVDLIYTRHAQIIPWGKPHPITAKISNVGTTAMSAVWAHLKVTGANSRHDSTLISTLPVSSSTLVNFNNYFPQNLGADVIQIYISNDNEALNNSLNWNQYVSNNEIGYADSSNVWYNFGWTTGSGIFCNRYTIAGKRRISKVRAQIGFTVANVGNTVYGVVLNSSGDVVGESAPHAITAGELGKWIEFDIYGLPNGGAPKPPPLITSGDFYAGLAVPGSGYNPMSLQMEIPNRIGTYFYHALASSPTFTDLAVTAGLDRFRQAINARLDGTSLLLEPNTTLKNPSCAGSNQTIQVTVTNKDSIDVDFSVDTMHIEVSSTGAITQKFSSVISNGYLQRDSSATYTITNFFDLSVAGLYNVKIHARQWMEVDTANNYQTLNINVVDTPKVTLTVSPDSTICQGLPFTFTAIPYTAGSQDYQWKINGINSGPVTNINTFSPILLNEDEVMVDLITDHCTTSTFSVSSKPITMRFNPKPKLISGIAVVDTVIEFKKKNYGIPLSNSTYKWKVVGGTLSDTVGTAVTITWGGPNTNASITVTETDSNNCVGNHVLPVVVISVVGIDDLNPIGIGEAYPNPADQSVRIPVMNLNGRSNDINLSLYDLSGKKVVEIYIGSIDGNREFVLSTATLQDGLYFYRIRTGSGYEAVKKLTIQH